LYDTTRLLRKIVVSQDVKFDKDARSSMSQEPPTKIQEIEKLIAPKTNPQIPNKSNSNQLDSSTHTKASLLLVKSRGPNGLPRQYRRHETK
jgi:hypothetical protein